MDQPHNEAQPVKPQLGLWDAVSIIIGIVIGAGIYESPWLIFSNVPNVWMGLVIWVIGGLLALVGALCYAELATTYPREGGDYVYLTRAFGPWVGFLFGWAQLAVILTGSIGAMAYVFAKYAAGIWNLGEGLIVALAMLAVVVLSVLNLLGVVFGKGVQNLLTAAKVLGLGGIVVAGFFHGQPQKWAAGDSQPGIGWGALAIILVLYTYGGWNDAAFVAAEVREPRRNIPRALLLGTGSIMLIYLLVNAAYLLGLGFEEARKPGNIAARLLENTGGSAGATGISVLVMISALGALNGLIFTGSRVYSTLGSEHSVFAWLGQWHPRLGVPHWSLLVQALIALTMIAVVGTTEGQQVIDQVLTAAGLQGINWEKYGGGFGTLVSGTAPVFWLFFLLTGLSLFALREKDRHLTRPFAVPFYPFLPFIFCLMCVYMLYKSTEWAEWLALFGVVPLLIGVPLYFVSTRRAAVEKLPSAAATSPARY
ncbi:MAG TPA: amino acid permease [Gemmataceae bacterium]|nr:amino acid permease [Gemmataceae bacterium]